MSSHEKRPPIKIIKNEDAFSKNFHYVKQALEFLKWHLASLWSQYLRHFERQACTFCEDANVFSASSKRHQIVKSRLFARHQCWTDRRP